MLSKMFNLEENHPEIYKEFLEESISLQMPQVFRRVEVAFP